ncbi:hypothetical protein SAMD00019534_054010 [Acytostelium subglobosum LB1]|uniref:hypothetical protein n=1 Tax=Acytostelium subglobosum LB1 TaxID=1410327 RepID=UPI000644EBD8|nr:hypothetical protein SAMD00019534_054010 [Acytostelium subglobosum LB1]GAM22226.1 hypothetical protein SAMD00019534_054010 [Acytostelium subglobosum LB1]|eukprot:XP_012755326.1 hypothetical protein SAMD00019534_054010 [Acytostelium subglobosum LB1]
MSQQQQFMRQYHQQEHQQMLHQQQHQNQQQQQQQYQSPSQLQQHQQQNQKKSIDLKMLASCTLENDQLKRLSKDDLRQIDSSLLDREIRTTLFPLFHAVLKNPPETLTSQWPHSVEGLADLKQQGNAKGFLYLFDRSAKDYYANDGIRWAKTKTNVRMIIFNEDQQVYKLKTHKKDVGAHVMRRQTFGGVCDNGIFWKKFEYKLIKREYLLKLEDDGSPECAEDNDKSKYSERLCVQDFPILVHYLTRPAAESVTIEDSDDQPVISSTSKRTSLSSQNNNNHNNNNNNNNNNIIFGNNNSNNISSNETKKRESPFNLSSISSSTILNLFKKKKIDTTPSHPKQHSVHEHSSTSSSPEFIAPSLQHPVAQDESALNSFSFLGSSTLGATSSATSTTAASNTDDNYFLDFADSGWSNYEGNNVGTGSSSAVFISHLQQSFPYTYTGNGVSSPLTFDSDNANYGVNIPPMTSVTTSSSSSTSIPSTTTTTTTTSTNSNTTVPLDSYNAHQQTNQTYLTPVSVDTPSTPSTPINISQPSAPASISSYSPDTSPSLEQTKIICLVNGFNCFAKTSKVSPIYYSFWAVFEGGIEILALPISPEVLEFNSPIWGDAAITHFHIVCKQNGSKNIVQQTSSVPFCFTPSDHRGKLKIAFDRCKSMPLSIIPKFRHSVKHLDLSNNALTSVDFLSGFYRLESLTLNNNQLTEHTVFPTLPELQHLDLSSNLINCQKVALFTERLIHSAPYLQSINLVDNEEYPCPFKVPHHHYNYRIYIISRFSQLTKLDLQAVSIEERKHAHNVVEQEEQDR